MFIRSLIVQLSSFIYEPISVHVVNEAYGKYKECSAWSNEFHYNLLSHLKFQIQPKKLFILHESLEFIHDYLQVYEYRNDIPCILE